MRGKHSPRGYGGVQRRITPAYAGKTRIKPCLLGLKRDHPRVCGENYKNLHTAYHITGSPPRMRGKREALTDPEILKRITPAYAGKTPCSASGSPAAKDHPRVCGENGLDLHECRVRGGSPPRMRGKPRSHFSISLSRRITPAYAGKTPHWRAAQDFLQDHPRVCGENMRCWHLQCPLQGSPPRMRGKRTGGRSDWMRHRITPAYAGKTGAELRKCEYSQDHPRVCGENTSEMAYFRG